MAALKIEDGNVYMQKAGDWIKIGNIDKKNKIFSTFRDRNRHLFNIYNGYGFMRELLLGQDEIIEYVFLKEKTSEALNHYMIPIDIFNTEGKYYAAKGYERQVFLSLETIEMYKTN